MDNNIRQTAEIVVQSRRKNVPGIVCMLDWEKCFDRTEYDSIKKIFKYFGFGDVFISLLFLLFTKFNFCTINAGHTSPFVRKERGVNQGCPASPLVWIYAGEILAHLVKGNDKIQGIPLKDLKDILSQFADDTGAFLKFENETIMEFCSCLALMERNIGLKVSYDKTILYRIGSLVDSCAKLYTDKQMQWSSKPIDTLGVQISCEGVECDENFLKVLQKLKQVCINWYNRNLTISGKILVINTLMSSLFVYKMLSFVKFTQEQIDEIQKVIVNFLWKGARPRISYNTLICTVAQGGLSLCDIESRAKVFRIMSVFQAMDNPFLRSCMQQELVPCLGNVIWHCNIKAKDIRKCFKSSRWCDALLSWSEINVKELSNVGRRY